jgi:NTP pyrophosphatase (non-canonical NTP hydrolase)
MPSITPSQAAEMAHQWHGQAGGALLPSLTANELAAIINEALLKQTSYQARIHEWVLECFGPVVAGDKRERNHRFLEEAMELVQACGCTQFEAHQLVNYVFSRPVGDTPQEVGGVMLTLASLCHTQGIDMIECGETELARVWTKVEQIRAKQAAKPKHSPLPLRLGNEVILAHKKLMTDLLDSVGFDVGLK